jgi:tricorn protease
LPFVDGGDLRKPEFASFSSEYQRMVIEGHGVDPDIYIDNDPYKGTWESTISSARPYEVIKEQLKVL